MPKSDRSVNGDLPGAMRHALRVKHECLSWFSLRLYRGTRSWDVVLGARSPHSGRGGGGDLPRIGASWGVTAARASSDNVGRKPRD